VIASLTGRLVDDDADGLVIEVGGIGLRVYASSAASRLAREQPQSVKLQTYLVVREDALTLYGFATQRERGLFVALLGVSGLGPAKALALLSGYPVDTLQRGIAMGDLALLASVSGIGKRTAERIVVELREKVAGGVPDGDAIVITRADDPRRLARDGLVELGFTIVEADELLRDAPDDTPEALIAGALRAARR
jgi:Holliday junction DNA helicase RuvA